MIEIDRLGDELGSSEFAGTASSIVVAIGGHHHYGQIGATLPDLAEQFQSVHARHVDVRQYSEERRLDFFPEPIQRLCRRGSEMHQIVALASLTTEALAKQVGHIRLIIHNQDTHAHDAASAIATR